MIGTTISHYKILEKLGEGGMGVVYRAEDTKLNRPVALKFLPVHVRSSEPDKARFLQEAQAAAALSHPNICTIFGIEEHDGQLFIAMELVEGETLRDMRVKLSLKQAIEIGIQLADGLAAAHEKGIVHRDLKPENVMIRKDGRVQIMDFGLAKLRSATRLTKEGSTVGTAGYMSPEQVQGFETDHRTDIFSLGVILYELLAGQSPFRGVHETAINYEIVNVDPDPISSIKPDVSPELDAIILDCLEKDPKERYQSTAEVARSLRRFKKETSRVSRMSGVRQASKISGVSRFSAAFAERKILTIERIAWLSGIAILVAVVMYLGFKQASTEALVHRSTILPPEKTSFHVALGNPLALSPNGRLLAFVAQDSSGKRLLWVRPLSAISGQPLTGTEGALYPFWSPDSRFIGFFAEGKLRKIEAAGGPPQTICDASLNARGGAWNRDGIILFTAAISTPLTRVSATGGAPTIVTKLDTVRRQVGHRWPYFLPDGKHFLYLARTQPAGASEIDAIFLSSLDLSVTKLLIHTSSNAVYASGHLLFLRENSLMAQRFDTERLELSGDAFPIAERVQYFNLASSGNFSASENGILVYQTGSGEQGMRMVWLDRSGRELGTVDKTAGIFSPRISPDEKKIAADLFDRTSSDIWIYEPTRNNIRAKFTFDPANDRNPIWSPDGKNIFFSSARKGRLNIYQKASSGAASDELLFESNDDKYTSDISLDGKFLLYHTIADQWILPLSPGGTSGERKPILFLQTEFNEGQGRFSPDARWIVYTSNKSGRNEIYVRPFPGPGGEYLVSTEGGTRAKWRRDGKEIFYIGTGNRFMVAEVNTRGDTFEVVAIRHLFDLPSGFNTAGLGYDVSADGQRLLIVTFTGLEASLALTLVVNWDAELH